VRSKQDSTTQNHPKLGEENKRILRTDKEKRKRETRNIKHLTRKETETKNLSGEEQGGENQRFRGVAMKETKR